MGYPNKIERFDFNISVKNQAVVPRGVLDRLGHRPGDKLEFRVSEQGEVSLSIKGPEINAVEIEQIELLARFIKKSGQKVFGFNGSHEGQAFELMRKILHVESTTVFLTDSTKRKFEEYAQDIKKGEGVNGIGFFNDAYRACSRGEAGEGWEFSYVPNQCQCHGLKVALKEVEEANPNGIVISEMIGWTEGHLETYSEKHIEGEFVVIDITQRNLVIHFIKDRTRDKVWGFADLYREFMPTTESN